MMRIIKNLIVSTAFALASLGAGSFALAADAPVNYFYERGAMLDVIDNIGDDKGPGYYQYPADKRMRRGTFDIKRFSAYEEGDVIVFEIQMRNYIMREWPDTKTSEDQGFVANLWDIYIDLDGIDNSGYNMALPGRDVFFCHNKGWEKVILVSPLSEYEMFDILRNKTDELEFQNRVEDIVYPDYVRIQRDKAIIKISKLKLPGISVKSGFQCFSMGFKKIVSPNRLLNRDVKAFSTNDDFGGGHDTYGDPPIMDIIVPEGDDQYTLLRAFRSEPYREDIEYASVPFVYHGGKKASPGLTKPPVEKPPVIAPAPVVKSKPGFIPLEPVTKTEDINGFQPLPKAPTGFLPIKKKP